MIKYSLKKKSNKCISPGESFNPCHVTGGFPYTYAAPYVYCAVMQKLRRLATKPCALSRALQQNSSHHLCLQPKSAPTSEARTHLCISKKCRSRQQLFPFPNVISMDLQDPLATLQVTTSLHFSFHLTWSTWMALSGVGISPSSRK